MNPSQRDNDVSTSSDASAGSKAADARQATRRAYRGLMQWGQALCAALLLAVGVQAHGAVIEYSVTPLGGQDWKYEYTVTNDSGALTIEEFTIYFDVSFFSNLANAQAPADWEPLAIQPDPALPADGFFDALALGSGIAPGASMSGFSVNFTFLGTGTPGSQRFEIVDPETFDVLASGVTSPAGQAVSEPETLSLLLLAGFAAGAKSVRRRRGRLSMR